MRFILLLVIFMATGCVTEGLTKSETQSVFKVWNKRTEELEKAIAKGVFPKAKIKSMRNRDQEVTEILEDGCK